MAEKVVILQSVMHHVLTRVSHSLRVHVVREPTICFRESDVAFPYFVAPRDGTRGTRNEVKKTSAIFALASWCLMVIGGREGDASGSRQTSRVEARVGRQGRDKG